MEKLDVEVRFRCTPAIDDLREFDAVILATGGKVTRPDVPGVDLPLVGTFEDVLRCKLESCKFHPEDKGLPSEYGESVLVWGDHFGAADAAEKLAGDGKKVYVVTENQDFAEWMEPVHKDVMMKRFACNNGEGLTDEPFKQPVTVVANTTVVEIASDGEVTLMDNQFRKSSLKVDNVVLANVEPDDTMFGALLEAGITVTKIGDAQRVRNLRAAVTEGANAGLTLDEGLTMNGNRTIISKLPTEVRLA